MDSAVIRAVSTNSVRTPRACAARTPPAVRKRWRRPGTVGSARSQGKRDRRRNLGRYSRSYLPHRDHQGKLHHVTFRLADSLPARVVACWKEEIARDTSLLRDWERHEELRDRIQRFEDAGHGRCHLRRPEIAALVRTALLHFDGGRYNLIAWCVMPNHVHVLLRQLDRTALSQIVGSWKNWTARRANRILGRQGAFWMRDYHDREIRSPRHRAFTYRYIEMNPVMAGLCRKAEDWPWRSARERAQQEQGTSAPE